MTGCYILSNWQFVYSIFHTANKDLNSGLHLALSYKKNDDAWGIAKGQLILLVLFLAHIFSFIVKTMGTFLTHGTDERKYLKRKYSEL